MTNYHARVTKGSSAQYSALLKSHASQLDRDVAELEELDELIEKEAAAHSLVIADMPAPARGYAKLYALPSMDFVAVRLHVLDGQPEEVTRALLSTVYVRSQEINAFPRAIILDAELATDHVKEQVARFGHRYGISVADTSEFPEAVEQAGGEGVTDEPTSGGAEDPGNPLEDATTAVAVTTEGETPTETHETRDSSEENGEEVSQEETLAEEPPAPGSEFFCEECQREFKNGSGLASHRSSKHS